MKQDIIKIRRKPPWQVAVKEIRFLILPAFSVITAAFRHSEENPLPAKGQISKEIAFCSAKHGGKSSARRGLAFCSAKHGGLK
jgi:hypothetical protein